MKLMPKTLVGLAILSILLISGCTAEPTPIRIGVNAWPPCEIWLVAEEQGYFGDTPVELVRFSSWSDNMSSLYKGDTDITHATYFNAVYYHDKGEPGQIILASDSISGGDGLVVKKGIASGEDLKGKRIAVEINTDEHFLLKKALESYGLTEQDVSIRSTTSIDAMRLFIKGEVDACFTYNPFMSQAAEQGDGHVIWTTEDLPGYMIDVLVARNAVVKARKKDLQTILTAWYRAQDYIRDNGAEVFPMMAKAEGMPADDFAAFHGSFSFYGAQENKELFSSAPFEAKLEEMNEFLFTHNAIKRKARIQDLYTSEIVEGME